MVFSTITARSPFGRELQVLPLSLEGMRVKEKRVIPQHNRRVP